MSPLRRWALRLRATYTAKSLPLRWRGKLRSLSRVTAHGRTKGRVKQMGLEEVETTRQETLLPLLGDNTMAYILYKGGCTRQ